MRNTSDAAGSFARVKGLGGTAQFTSGKGLRGDTNFLLFFLMGRSLMSRKVPAAGRTPESQSPAVVHRHAHSGRLPVAR